MEFFFFKKIIIAKFCLKQMRTMKKFELKNLYNARVTIISIFVSENENIYVSCIAVSPTIRLEYRMKDTQYSRLCMGAVYGGQRHWGCK